MFVRNARPNTPSTRASILCSIARRTLTYTRRFGASSLPATRRRAGLERVCGHGRRRLLDRLRPAPPRSRQVGLEREREAGRRRRRQQRDVRSMRRGRERETRDDEAVARRGERAAAADERQGGGAERERTRRRRHLGVPGQRAQQRLAGGEQPARAGDVELLEAAGAAERRGDENGAGDADGAARRPADELSGHWQQAQRPDRPQP